MIRSILAFWYRLIHRKERRTIRYSSSILTIAVASLVATVILSNSGTSIYLETDTSSVQAGDVFSVNVYIDAKESINAITIAVQFDPDEVTVQGVNTGASVISLWTADPYVRDNQVILEGGTFRRGFIGRHLIAEIELEAVAAGETNFSLSESVLVKGDGQGSVVHNVEDTEQLAVFISETGDLSVEVRVQVYTDINGDGRISISDINQFLSAWRSREVLYDFNADNKMNFTDFAIILADSFVN